MTTKILHTLKVCFLMAIGVGCLTTSALAQSRALVILTGGTYLQDIGPGCEKSIGLMENAFTNISAYTGMEVDFLYCTGYDFVKDRILEKIDLVPAGLYDVIVFFNTSHGFNYLESPTRHTFFIAHPTKYGQMTQFEFDEYGVSLEFDVKHRLEEKGANLLLVISESCNSVINATMPPQYLPMNVGITQRLKELFLESSGTIMVSSSDLDQASYTDIDNGGYFTNAFNHAMNDIITSKERATWNAVLTKTSTYTQEYAKYAMIQEGQQPYYNIQVIDTGIELKASSNTDADYHPGSIQVKKQ
ncbi:MAG: hypothetical protein KDC44_09485 [Phaeodactylibacter sp.]|nr:hypothetical protein [Phaeodactylibacter sp.]